MHFGAITSPHVQPERRVAWVMRQVIYALIPGTLAYIWFFGWAILINIVFAALVAVAFEAAMLAIRHRPLRPFLTDNSAIVTAWLLALALPTHSPWWLILIAVGFAMIAGKHLYGGLGYNPFNPAMAGYVLVLISFPVEMTRWVPATGLVDSPFGILGSLQTFLTGEPPGGQGWDAITMATPLDAIKTGLAANLTISEIRASPLFGDFGGVGWEWIANWWFIGGLFLFARGIINWRIPVSVLLGLGAMATAFFLIDPDAYGSPGYHIFSGGAMLGAFFIATDPVSASTTPRGQLIYGAGIGVLTYVIRSWGGYPDGIAFAVLLMNMAAPTIDYYTQPRVFGTHKDS
jgi:electron transport complex protein RnfD